VCCVGLAAVVPEAFSVEACAQAKGTAADDAGAGAEKGSAAVVERHAGVEDAGGGEGKPFCDEVWSDGGFRPGDDGGFGKTGCAGGVNEDSHGVPQLATPGVVWLTFGCGGSDFGKDGWGEECDVCDASGFELIENFWPVLGL